jgi:hypothetical protein
MGEHVVEATSHRVRNTLSHRDELWDRRYEDLMANSRIMLEQEMVRLSGDLPTCSTNPLASALFGEHFILILRPANLGLIGPPKKKGEELNNSPPKH